MVALEEEGGHDIKWRFKAVEHMVKLHFRLGQYKYVYRYTRPAHLLPCLCPDECLVLCVCCVCEGR